MTKSLRLDSRHSLNEIVCDALMRVFHGSNNSVKWRVEQDCIRLTGAVSSYYEKQIAQEALLQMPELGTVMNQLQVTKTE